MKTHKMSKSHISMVPLTLCIGVLVGDIFALLASCALHWGVVVVACLLLVVALFLGSSLRVFLAFLSGFLLGAFCAGQ